MELEIQKPQTGTLATVRQSFAEARATAVAHLLYLMGQQYNLEITDQVTALWQEALKDLTPNQIRDGYVTYAASESARFKPQPGDIIANAPQQTTDRPRKVKDPKCPDCRGTGYRMIEVDSLFHPGKKAKRVTDCFCVRYEYGGQIAAPSRQLPAAEIPEREAKATVGSLAGKLSDVVKAARPFPPRARQMTDQELRRRNQSMLDDLGRKEKDRKERA